MFVRLIFTGLLICLVNYCFSQIIINEICADNETIFKDEFCAFPDWIELYNSSSQPIDLTDFHISDNINNPDKWTFPNTIIPANEYLIIIADGLDTYEKYYHTNFKLSKNGEILVLTNPTGQTVDSVTYPKLTSDNTYNRVSNGWIINQPSPGYENINISNSLSSISWSIKSGIYDQTQWLSFTHDQQEPIYYSINDLNLDSCKKEYTEPIELKVSSTICVHESPLACVRSKKECHSFILASDHNLPIVSLTVDSFEFFDPEKGMYSSGPDASTEWPFWGANFWKELESEVHINYFENNELKLSQVCAIKMHGGRESRTVPMKSFRLLAKDKYGQDYFNYPFFENKPYARKFKKLVLRNASGDYNEAHLRDGFINTYLSQQKLNLDINAYQPVVVYINGQFFGLMGIREKIDEYYIESNFNLDLNTINILEEDAFVVHGDSTDFLQVYNNFINADITNINSLHELNYFVEIDNFTDYFIVQMSLNNTAWPNNNIKYWQELSDNSLWRYILFDADAALGRYEWTDADINVFELKLNPLGDDNLHYNIFKKLMSSSFYFNYFLNRNQDIVNHMFDPEAFSLSLMKLVQVLEHDIQHHFDKWDPQTGLIWQSEKIQKIKTYINERPEYIAQHLVDQFNLVGHYNLNLKSRDSNKGYIKINTLDSISNLQGRYFSNVPIQLSAMPQEGYSFEKWKIIIDNEVQEHQDITINFDSEPNKSVSIEAYFKTNNELPFIVYQSNQDLTIEVKNNYDLENSYLQIFTLDGKNILNKPISNNTRIITLCKAHMSGVNIVSLRSGEEIYSTKILIP